MGLVQLAPRPLVAIVQWLLQQHEQQRSVHNGPNDTPAAPQLLAATESLRDSWQNDAATLERLQEFTTLDLSACKISSHYDRHEYEERWASDKLSILLDCMPQLTSLDLRNSPYLKWTDEERYRDQICDASLLEAIGKLTSLQVLRVGAVCEPNGWARGLARDQGPDRRAAGLGLAVLAGALKCLTRLTELKLTVGPSLDAFEEGGEELFGAIAGLPVLRILHMPVRRIGDIKAHSPAVATSLAGALSALKKLADLNLQHHKFCLGGATSLVNALQSLPGLTHLTTGVLELEKLPAGIGGLTALREIDLSGCYSLKELPAELGALTQLQDVKLEGCDALHTPPWHVVGQGTGAVLEFLRDLAKGDAPCHLIKVVLLGKQRAGKSSLADSLVQGWPVTRADSDRTVGIEVRRWTVGRGSQLVVNIYDAAGQRVYRATHGLFMSAGALFLHVVRSDMPEEEEAVEMLLEWVEVVQQEAPGAVMGVVWTHIDCALATVSKSRVLGRVHEEINKQMRAVDDAMREMEDVIADHLQDRGADQGGCLCEKWMGAREQRDAALKALDQRAMVGCTADDEVVGAGGGGGQSERNTISEMAEALASAVAHQREMEVLEDQLSMPQSVGNGEPLGEQLKRLRHKRLHRPRMLFSYSVSSRTGEGLHEMRNALTALMENQRLFPHVGAKVPLNYSMLERLAQEGRTQASEGTEAYLQPDHVKTSDGDIFEYAWSKFGTRLRARAAWELDVTKHVKERASDGLRNVCKKPYVRLGELEEEASKVGMDKDEVLRALKFLHAAGSVLHYGSDTRRSSPGLQNTVFMQPQFIIDAISYVIREPRADNVNDEVRKNDERIRQTSTDRGEALHKYLGCAAGYGCTEDHGSGVLPKWLLTRHLWFDFDPQDHRVLLQLMMAFKLLRPLVMGCKRSETLSERVNEQYLVPAMLCKGEMPSEYVEPHWWCPTKACAAAVKHADSRALAKMRIVYQVQGGRLPYGFMSELQVSIASLAHTESVDEEMTSAPDTAVVDRICGTVLSEAYTCGGGDIREWVTVSKAGPRHEQANVSMTGLTTDCIRIMGWVELHPSSTEGATDWRLLRRIMREIEGMEQRAPALCLRKMALYVDAHGKVAKALDIAHQGRDFFRFTFEGGGQRQEVDVKREHVIPSDSWGKIKLVKPKESCVSKGTLNVVDAFFAKKTDEHAINVHAEGQLMRRTVMDPGCGWDCSLNPQPTIQDLYTSISFARQRNVRVLHLSGHAREQCGFIWNANDAATAHKTFDIEEISRAIGKVAGKKGPVECVVLNACSTEKMGRLLLEQGVPCVLCWKTPVQDETARELVDEFYPPLVEDKSGSRGYKEAFLAAVKKMGVVDAGGADTTVSGESRRPSTTTRNASPDASSTRLERESAKDQGYGKSSQGGPVGPCELDVVLFLSADGHIGPFSLWRERPAAGQASAAEDAVDAGLKSLFVRNGLDEVCADVVCRGLKVAFGVKCLEDLKHITSQDVNAELPKFVPRKLTLVDQRKVAATIEGQRIASVVTDAVSSPAASAMIEQPGGQISAPASTLKPRIEGFFCKKNVDKTELLKDVLLQIVACKHAASDMDEQATQTMMLVKERVAEHVDGIDVHKEAEELKTGLTHGRQKFEVDVHPQPSFDTFEKCMLSARQRNVRILIFTGHGNSQSGFVWLKNKQSATEYEEIEPERFVKLFTKSLVAGAGSAGTIECVVLNACNTEEMGERLRQAGVPHVVCWRSEVKDTTATKFALDFHTSLDQEDVTKGMDYKFAFEQAVARMSCGGGAHMNSEGGAAPLPQRHLARGAVDYVCLLSVDGSEFPDTGHIDAVSSSLEGEQIDGPATPLSPATNAKLYPLQNLSAAGDDTGDDFFFPSSRAGRVGDDAEDVLGQRLVGAHDFDHPSPSGGSGQLKRRREEDMTGQSSSTNGSEAGVQGGARQRRGVSDEILAGSIQGEW